MSTPASRPVHPCVLSLSDYTRGVEFCVWANITTRGASKLPNLVSASASTVLIYSVDPVTHTLALEHSFGKLAGSIVSLAALPGRISDALVVGFSGEPRLTVLTVVNDSLQAVSLIDLTSLTSNLATDLPDMMVCSSSDTVACVLGGGVAIAVLSLRQQQSATWKATEPYVIPLASLDLPHRPASTEQGMTTGFGDISHAIFIQGYLEPVLVVLHTDPGGRSRFGNNYCTALSISTAHRRTAVLWSTVVPMDALFLTASSSTLLLVGANTMTFLDAAGNVEDCVAANGWAAANEGSSKLRANQPVPLAIALDGSQWAWVSAETAIVALRRGHMYVLQKQKDQWSLLPTGQMLGGVGQVETLVTLDLPSSASWLDAKLKKTASPSLLFAGSRLGDSLLLGIALDHVSAPEVLVGSGDTEDDDEPQVNGTTLVDSSTADIVRLEDEALYSPSTTTEPDLVLPSDSEETVNGSDSRKRARTPAMSVLRALEPLDTLANLGPLGPACEGPLSTAPSFLTDKIKEDAAAMASGAAETPTIFGASALIFPTGHGSSGGLAFATVPGQDDRLIVTEEDCLNVESIFSLAKARFVCIAMATKAGGGFRVLSVAPKGAAEGTELRELRVDDVSAKGNVTVSEVFQSTLLGAGEGSDGTIVFVVQQKDSAAASVVVASSTSDGGMVIESLTSVVPDVESQDGTEMTRVTPVVPLSGDKSKGSAAFGCLWNTGGATVVSVNTEGVVSTFPIHKTATDEPEPMDTDSNGEEIDQEAKKLSDFYADGSVVAVDVFLAPSSSFPLPETPEEVQATTMPVAAQLIEEPPKVEVAPSQNDSALPKDWSKLTVAKLKEELKKREIPAKGKKADLVAALEESDKQARKVEAIVTEPAPSTNDPQEVINEIDFSFNEDDEELYGIDRDEDPAHVSTGSSATRNQYDEDATEEAFVAVFRKSGHLEVYTLSSLSLRWTVNRASLGLGSLKPSRNNVEEAIRLPRSHKVATEELRFFYCGQAVKASDGATVSKALCVAVETSDGDMSLYLQERSRTSFRRVPLQDVARTSREQSRHHTKLQRKGIIGKEGSSGSTSSFRYNILHRFEGISGQLGLFAAGPRPQWILCERGMPTLLAHRTRHAAPAGGKPRPVGGFCPTSAGGFLTLHERVGNVGSQRLTLFRGISNVLSGAGVLPGSGFGVEKILFGATVRKIVFIDDESASTGEHPLYAVLVSRELEIDQSEHNSDGLSDEERKELSEAKEAVRTQKQVEADLGGFDLDYEWVEKIEREDCYEIDAELGGAPPIHQSIYSLWIVDAANKWMVVDSHDLGEHEHGLDLKVMSLTEFKEEPGSSAANAEANEDAPKRTFVVVGAGTVNHDGEDVSTKGRVLLFSVTKSAAVSAPVAELSLVYEKNIFHGPVTTVSCLSAEGKNRLVIGAGSDVNIEQWGSNEKLTQVGFFRATMHILDISHFKNFLLLSDAFDSLYFLVWRESDKSLTLLAKDYDPIPVCATGIMTRGPAMTFLVHDNRQNLQFFQYAPGESAARGGNKLVCRADFHLGTLTTSLQSHFCRPSLLVHSATPSSTFAALKQQDALFGRQDDDQRIGVHFGTADGGFGSVVPLSEPVYWRLMALQSVLANALESDCSLSHRAWRLYRRSNRRGGCRTSDRKKGVIDGDLVFSYVDLPKVDQEDLASAIGSTVDLVMDNLLEIQCGSMII